MKKARLVLIATLAMLGLLTATLFSQSTRVKASYQIRLVNPDRKLFFVEAEFDFPRLRDSVVFKIEENDNHYTGKYWQYVRDVQLLAADSAEKELVRADSNLWVARKLKGQYRLKYAIPLMHLNQPSQYGVDETPFYVGNAGVLIGSALIIYPAVEKDALPENIEIQFLPSGNQLAVMLGRRSGDNKFILPNLDYIMDAYWAFGAYDTLTLGPDSNPLVVAFQKNIFQFPDDQLLANLSEIWNELVGLFGRPPLRNPLMIVSAFPFSDRSREALNSGAGSIGSISILLDRKLAAGEFNENSGIFVYNLFSQWNPVTFAPAERINSRWMIQGVANYYQLLVLVRTGLISEQVFLNHLASAYEHYYRELNQRQISPRSARNVDAAQGYVQAAELLTALSVDLKMRSAIARPSSLDNLLAGLAQRFSGNNRTYSDIQLYELIDTLSGLFLKPYVDTCLNYPIRMNVPMLLNDFGIKMELVRKGQPDLGLRFKSSTDFTVVDLPRGGAAFDAGLESGDKILKINGRTFGSVDSLATYVNGRKVGDKLKVEYLRGKEKLTTTLILEGLDQWRASISPERTPAQAERWKKLVSPLS